MPWFSETYPICASSRAEIFRELTPSNVALPRVGSRMFISTLIVVVFPAPFAPIIANALPSGTSKLNPRSASKRPNFFQRFSMRIIYGSPPGAFELCPLLLNRLQNVADIEIHALRLDHKLLHLALQEALSLARPRLWNLCHYRSNPR